MAEGHPPPLGSWNFIGFVEGPIVEEIGEFLGRVTPIGRGVDGIIKILPLPALQAALKKKKQQEKAREKQDGWRVLKVKDAIDIIDEELTGFAGSVNEIGDFVAPFLPSPGDPNALSLRERLVKKIRDAALFQGNNRLTGRWIERPHFDGTDGQGGLKWSQGKIYNGHTNRTQLRTGAMHHDQPI